MIDGENGGRDDDVKELELEQVRIESVMGRSHTRAAATITMTKGEGAPWGSHDPAFLL